jgi:hypothetical protein
VYALCVYAHKQALSSDGHKVLVSKALREMTLSTSDVCAALIDNGCMQVLAKLAKAELAEVSSKLLCCMFSQYRPRSVYELRTICMFAAHSTQLCKLVNSDAQRERSMSTLYELHSCYVWNFLCTALHSTE